MTAFPIRFKNWVPFVFNPKGRALFNQWSDMILNHAHMVLNRWRFLRNATNSDFLEDYLCIPTELNKRHSYYNERNPKAIR